MDGAVVWFTGLPRAGKSTLARAAYARLGRRAVLLDENELHDTLVQAGARMDSFDAIVARLASRLARQGWIALVAAASPRRHHREAARAAAPRFVEVHVATPREVFAGRAHDVYGEDEHGYEPPALPDVIARGGSDGLALERILVLLDEPSQAPQASCGAAG